MKNYDIGIKRFVRDGWKAVEAGYRPGYMDCVSFAAFHAGAVMTLPLDKLREYENPWHMTVGDIVANTAMFVLLIIIALTYPIGIWFWAALMKYNIDLYVTRREMQNDD